MLLGQSLKPVYGYEMQVLQIKFVCSFLSGPREIRTLDLLNAIETRSQLRHGPIFFVNCAFHLKQKVYNLTVDLEGVEPSTSSVRLKRAPNCATGPCPSRYQGLIFYLINGGLVKVQKHLLAIIRKNRVENSPKINGISILQAFSANGIVPCSVTSVEQKQRFSRIKRLSDFGLINRTGSLVLICL